MTANTLGAVKSYQRQLFEIRNQVSDRWEYLGDNTESTGWNAWFFWNFTLDTNVDEYMNNDKISVRFRTDNKYDVVNMDYIAMHTTTNTVETFVPTLSPTDGVTDSIWKPKASDRLTWQWQLSGDIDTSFDVDMYDIDLFDVSIETIDFLKSEGRIVVCYFSAGSYEGWRDDWREFFPDITDDNYEEDVPPFANKMSGWDERWLDIRYIDLLEPIMRSRLQLAKDKGCDAVEPDNMDAYANGDETGLDLTGDDQLAYNIFIANAAHDVGLSVGIKNDVDQLDVLVNYFDWALNEQCFEYDECDTYDSFVDVDKAVFGVEYVGLAAVFCLEANNGNLSWLKKRLSLDAYRIGCEDFI
eukprot:CAMPEP_0118699674 /NCGR_PEP_ID=MMETSP0800-20121206/16056_1 /TAXON_ID=210618 ORGANISM="Striatella unipunctata, Strain CCMP2910" /NCGR_SAMPLE_ID=MMETSP0800 /ASSEMBLY_ACC=CAM_ASM_000638 /LENGTH=355 /DNA_ID=CAMNT_0006599969 /DNA_START=94 /DNA_END=1161 /DNA_ORIENTATION=+